MPPKRKRHYHVDRTPKVYGLSDYKLSKGMIEEGDTVKIKDGSHLADNDRKLPWVKGMELMVGSMCVVLEVTPYGIKLKGSGFLFNPAGLALIKKGRE